MEKLTIYPEATVKNALKMLDSCGLKAIFVTDSDRKLLGALTDGDIRRHLLGGGNLDDTIESIYNTNPIISKTDDPEFLKKQLLNNKIDILPVINDDGKIIKAVSWEDLFSESFEDSTPKNTLKIPVVLMAGGLGSRLQPFTKVLPKPLIPLGEKTVLEILIDKFCEYRIDNYYVTLNYKGELIKSYFDILEKQYQINYVWEKEFYGTAGSLKLIENLEDTFIVSNCDIVIKADYSEIVDFHKSKNALLTVVSSIQHHTIPYGVIEYSDGGIVTGINEKPEFSFPVNTGFYILEPEVLSYIPDNSFFHMTHLIEALIADEKTVVTYLVNENDYIDIGQWEEYQKAAKILK